MHEDNLSELKNGKKLKSMTIIFMMKTSQEFLVIDGRQKLTSVFG